MDPDDLPNTIMTGDIRTIGVDDFPIGTVVYDTTANAMFVQNGTDFVEVVSPEAQSPTKVLRTFVNEELTFDQRDQLIIDYEQFEIDGTAGDNLLREIVDQWKARLGSPPIADFFGPARDIMFEVYRARSETIIDNTNVIGEDAFYS